MNSRIERPDSSWHLTERGKFARNSLIAIFAIGLTGVCLSNSINDQAPRYEEIACTMPMQEPGLESFADKYLGADSPSERKMISTDIATQSGLNDPSSIAIDQSLKLTAEQCMMVVDNGGEVTLVDPSTSN